MISFQQFVNLFPNAFFKGEELKTHYEALCSGMRDMGITTAARESMFLAQCAHESMGFARIVENLNYDIKGLLTTFGKYFNETNIKDYARKPQKIANRVYANRMGNGDEASGDGWKYRGMGIIQLTGKEDHEKFFASIQGDDKDLLSPRNSALTACWFWDKIHANKFADKDQFDEITRRINGDLQGPDVQDRRDWLAKIISF